MPPRWAPKAYQSPGASLIRLPGCKKLRGTQVGVSRSRPAPASSALRAICQHCPSSVWSQSPWSIANSRKRGTQPADGSGRKPFCFIRFSGDVASGRMLRQTSVEGRSARRTSRRRKPGPLERRTAAPYIGPPHDISPFASLGGDHCDGREDLGSHRYEARHPTTRISRSPRRTGQGVSAKRRTLRGGVSEGVDTIEIDNGKFRFVVVPTRGMGLWKAWLGKIEIGWKSPVQGPVHPQFVPITDPSGLGWLEGFDELIVPLRPGKQRRARPGAQRRLQVSAARPDRQSAGPSRRAVAGRCQRRNQPDRASSMRRGFCFRSCG